LVSGGKGAHGERVLIVEDDSAIAELVRLVLEDELGVRSVIADDGERGLELARQLKPSVVLLDINLPKLSGLDVARSLKADPSTRSLALVAMTSASEEATREAGCCDHLAKPFEIDELVRLVSRYLDLADAEAAASPAEPEGQPEPPRAVAARIRGQGKPVRQKPPRKPKSDGNPWRKAA
jgi:two-component system, cell cycle response regulator DivK